MEMHIGAYGDVGVNREQWDLIKISRSRLRQIVVA